MKHKKSISKGRFSFKRLNHHHLRVKIFLWNIVLITLITVSLSFITTTLFTDNISKSTESLSKDNINLFLQTVESKSIATQKSTQASILQLKTFATINNDNIYSGIKERELNTLIARLRINDDAPNSITVMSKGGKFYSTRINSEYNIINKSFIYSYIIKNRKEIESQYSIPIWCSFTNDEDNIYCFFPVYADYIFDFQGIICVTYPTTFFSDFNQIDRSVVDYTYLYNQFGQPIMVADKKVAKSLENNVGTKEDSAFVNLNGSEYFVVNNSYPIKHFQAYFAIPTSTLYADVNHVKNINIIIFVFSLIIGILGCLFISINLTKKLYKLEKQMTLVESGTLKPVDLINSNDEIGMISKQFVSLTRRMSDLLEQSKIAEKQKQELRYSSLKSEYNQLIAQLNPHFIYNVLECINSFAKTEGNEKICEATSLLADDLRSSLKLTSEFLTLGEELKSIEKYLRLNQLMLDNSLEIIYDIKPPTTGCLVPARIIQPIIENSIVHGFRDTENEKVLIISSDIQDDNLVITISDSGCGMTKDKVYEFTHYSGESDYYRHFGVFSVIRRLKILYNDNQNHFGISSELGCGTVTTLKLPLKTEI